jgi:hypothetical protein
MLANLLPPLLRFLSRAQLNGVNATANRSLPLKTAAAAAFSAFAAKQSQLNCIDSSIVLN